MQKISSLIKASQAWKKILASIFVVFSMPLDENLNGNVQIQLVSDEEKGAVFGTIHIIDLIQKGRIKRPDCVIIGERSDLKIRNGEKGILIFDVKFKGRAAHTANVRSVAINAIVLAAKAILAIDKKIDKSHPEIGSPVISVNM